MLQNQLKTVNTHSVPVNYPAKEISRKKCFQFVFMNRLGVLSTERQLAFALTHTQGQRTKPELERPAGAGVQALPIITPTIQQTTGLTYDWRITTAGILMVLSLVHGVTPKSIAPDGNIAFILANQMVS